MPPLILLCMCRTQRDTYVVYYYICVAYSIPVYMRPLILLYMCPFAMRPHTTICVRILLNMCPHTTKCVSAYYCMCPHPTLYCSTLLYTSYHWMRVGMGGRQGHRKVGAECLRMCTPTCISLYSLSRQGHRKVGAECLAPRTPRPAGSCFLQERDTPLYLCIGPGLLTGEIHLYTYVYIYDIVYIIYIIYIHKYICIIYTYMCVCVCVCVYMYIYT
jgi:hypothetical protein